MGTSTSSTTCWANSGSSGVFHQSLRPRIMAWITSCNSSGSVLAAISPRSTAWRITVACVVFFASDTHWRSACASAGVRAAAVITPLITSPSALFATVHASVINAIRSPRSEPVSGASGGSAK